MGVQKDFDDNQLISDINFDNPDTLEKKRYARKKIEDYLELKRLRKELENEIDADFDWGDL